MRRRWLRAVSAFVLIGAVLTFVASDRGGPSRSDCESRWTANANDANFDLQDRERYIEDCMTTGKRVEDFR